MSPMAEKLLTLIGLPPVTNREAIMQEIEALSDEEFDRFIGGHSRLNQYIDESCGGVFNRIDWLKATNNEGLNLKEFLT